MPVHFMCPSCHASLEAMHQLIGKEIACPKCGKRLIVPLPQVAEAVPERPKPPPLKTIRPTRFAIDSDGDFVMWFRDADGDANPIGPEHGPTSPLVKVEVARDVNGVICNPFDLDEVAAIITTATGSTYGAVLDRMQVNQVNRLVLLCEGSHISSLFSGPARLVR